MFPPAVLNEGSPGDEGGVGGCSSHAGFFPQFSFANAASSFSSYGYQIALRAPHDSSPSSSSAVEANVAGHLRKDLAAMDPNRGDDCSDGVGMGEFGAPTMKRSAAMVWSWNEGEGSCSKAPIEAASAGEKLSKSNTDEGTLLDEAMNTKKAKAKRRLREPRFSFKTMSDVDVLDDGYKWRKYGQKVVKNTQHPRSYYRCTQDKCRVKKRVERLAEDPRMVITTYEGRHIHSPCRDGEDSKTPSQISFFC